MKRQYCRWILICALCIMLGGCGNEQNFVLRDELRILETIPDSPVSYEGNVGIYLDVTPSMEGFLGMDTKGYKELVEETNYKMCLAEVDKVLAGFFEPSQITYYRVDTPMWETEENVLKEGRSHRYYTNSKWKEDKYTKVDLIPTDGDDYESLCLTNALLGCKEDDFSVLITDFYENTGDASEVIQALKQNMKSGPMEKVIGIIGIRSEFAGTVYDLNLDGGRAEYGIVKGNITAEDICYRQFYVIVTGQEEIVQRFCQNVQGNMGLNEEFSKCIIFYEKQAQGMDFAAFKECYTRSTDRSWTLWPNSRIVINGGRELDVYDYRNANGGAKDIVVSYNVEDDIFIRELERGTASMKALSEMSEMELIEVPFRMEKQSVSAWSEEEQKFIVDESKSNAFVMENVYYSPEEKLLYIVFRISEKDSPQSPLKLNGEIHLEWQDNFHMEWVNEWNLGYGEENLGKTRDFRKYMDAIREQMPERSDLLQDFVFYIR